MALDVISSLLYPNPPGIRQVTTLEEANRVIQELISHQNQVAVYEQNHRQELDDLLEGATIRNLSVSNLTAGTIIVEDIFIGDSKFELDGVLQQIRVTDDQATPRVRVEIGKFGAGADYGIKVRNASNAIIFQAASTSFFDGGTISNATITGAKIIDAEIITSKIANDAVNENKRIAVYTATASGSRTVAASSSFVEVVTITHNLGRKVTATPHVQGMSLLNGTPAWGSIANSTTTQVIAHVILLNVTGSSFAFNWTLEVNYW